MCCLKVLVLLLLFYYDIVQEAQTKVHISRTSTQDYKLQITIQLVLSSSINVLISSHVQLTLFGRIKRPSRMNNNSRRKTATCICYSTSFSQHLSTANLTWISHSMSQTFILNLLAQNNVLLINVLPLLPPLPLLRLLSVLPISTTASMPLLPLLRSAARTSTM